MTTTILGLNGRITVPVHIRVAMGAKPGTQLVWSVDPSGTLLLQLQRKRRSRKKTKDRPRTRTR